MYITIHFIHFGGHHEIVGSHLENGNLFDGKRENLDKYGLINTSCKCHLPVAEQKCLRQETSRTACVSNHLSGRSSVSSHDHRFHQHIFSTLCACYKEDNFGRLTTGVAPKLDCCPRR